jgi:hypothetical protein
LYARPSQLKGFNMKTEIDVGDLFSDLMTFQQEQNLPLNELLKQYKLFVLRRRRFGIAHAVAVARTDGQRCITPIGSRVKTGAICPESAVWRVEDTPTATAPIAKGNRMPPYGRAVYWVLVSYA